MSLLLFKYMLHVAAILCMVSLSLRLGQELDKFYNFAIGAYFTLCPFVWHTLVEQGAISALPAACISAFLVGVLALLFEFVVFSPLRRRVARPDVRMLASIALSLIMTNIIAVLWGEQTRYFTQASLWRSSGGPQTFFTPLTISILVTWCVISACTVGALKYTYAGKEFRAVSSSSELARIFGINVDRVAITSGFLAAGIAGIAGCLSGADTSISHSMGMDVVLGGLAVAVLANRLSVGLQVLCALLVGGLYCAVSYYLRVQWGGAIALGVVLATFAIRSGVSNNSEETKA